MPVSTEFAAALLSFRYPSYFTIQIDLLKYKRSKDGGCAYNNTGSSHLRMYFFV